MPTTIANRRSDVRYRVPAAVGMMIEFKAPDGFDYSFPVTTLSAHGVSFSLPRRVQGIEGGQHVADVVIRVGKVRINGNLVVVHCGRHYGSDYNCGAQFCPLGDGDRNELVMLVSRLRHLARC